MASRPSAELTQRNPPSKVLYIAGLIPTAGYTEDDIIRAIPASASVMKVEFLPKREECLVEMDTVQAAQGVIAFAQYNAIRVGGRDIRISFSNRASIEGRKPRPGPAPQGAPVYGAPPPHDDHRYGGPAQQGSYNNAPYGRGGNDSYDRRAPPPPMADRRDAGPYGAPAAHVPLPPPVTSGAGGRVLHFTITLPFHPIDVNVINAIIKPYGELHRVVIFEKGGAVQALAELATPSQAANAMSKLDGQQIYDGCCNLRIAYAKNDTLQIKDNSEVSRDFLNPNLPTRVSRPPGGPQYQQAAAGMGSAGPVPGAPGALPAMQARLPAPPMAAPMPVAPAPGPYGVQGMYGAPPGYGSGGAQAAAGPAGYDRDHLDNRDRPMDRHGPAGGYDRRDDRDAPPPRDRGYSDGYGRGPEPSGGYYGGDRPVDRYDNRGPPPPGPYGGQSGGYGAGAGYGRDRDARDMGPGRYDDRYGQDRRGPPGPPPPGPAYGARDYRGQAPPPYGPRDGHDMGGRDMGRDRRDSGYPMDDRRLPADIDRRAVVAAAPGRGPAPPVGGPNGGPGCVLMVYNLPRSKVGPDQLFNLFCCYGNVMRVKSLTKPENANQVQMELSTSASMALDGLNRTSAFGVTIGITHSKTNNLVKRDRDDDKKEAPAPAAGEAATASAAEAATTAPSSDAVEEDAPADASAPADAAGVSASAVPATSAAAAKEAQAVVLKEYIDSGLNRFKAMTGPSKPPFKPNPILYFGNIPAGSEEAFVTATITAAGGHAPKSVVFLPPESGKIHGKPGQEARLHDGRRSGFIEYDNTETAMETLMMANNAKIEGSALHLKLSFSGKDKQALGRTASKVEASAAKGQAPRARSRSRERDGAAAPAEAAAGSDAPAAGSDAPAAEPAAAATSAAPADESMGDGAGTEASVAASASGTEAAAATDATAPPTAA